MQSITLPAWHNCINEAKKMTITESDDSVQAQYVLSTVFAELVCYIEETRRNEDTPLVFKLIDLANLYTSRLEQHGIKNDGRVHTPETTTSGIFSRHV